MSQPWFVFVGDKRWLWFTLASVFVSGFFAGASL